MLNIANVLTISRFVLVPVFLLLLFAAGGHSTSWRLVAAAVFGLASITDHIDGNLARSRGLVTDFGKIVDPIADKALTGSALTGLSLLGDLWWWVTIVIVLREILVTLLRFWVIRHGLIPASRGGKLKTFTQILAIGLYILPLPPAFTPIRLAGERTRRCRDRCLGRSRRSPDPLPRSRSDPARPTRTSPKRVLLPMPFAKIDRYRGKVRVHAILGSQFADVPVTKSLDQVTKLEEDRIVGYYGAGTLYATPARQEPLL